MATTGSTRRKAAILLMTIPAACAIVSIMLYMIVNWQSGDTSGSNQTTYSQSVSPQCSSGGLSSALDESCYPTETTDSTSTSVSGNVANIILYAIGVLSVFAFVPCMAIGIVLLVSDKKPTDDDNLPKIHIKNELGKE